MTVARSQLVDVSVTRYYHCISRCVRRAFLCGEEFEHRKQWIEDCLETLSQCFAVSVRFGKAATKRMQGKVRVSREVASILDRFRMPAEAGPSVPNS